MNRGIVLLAVKNPVYGAFAYNFAMTLKQHSPEIKIQLICDDEATALLTDYQFFDIITRVDKSFSEMQGERGMKFAPAKAKLNLYKFAAFEENIFMDVDSVCIKPVEHLFDKCKGKEFCTQVFDYCDSTATEFGNMLWATPQKAWEHFKLSNDAKLPASNSSFIYFLKGETSKQVFDTAYQELENNPLDRENHRMKWGSGQPDELYLNVALAKLNFNAEVPENPYVMFFSNKRMNSPDEINYSIIGLYGPKGAIHSTIVDYCQRVIFALTEKKNLPHHFKYSRMMREKFQHKRY